MKTIGRARPFRMPARKAAGRRLRLYVLGLALVRRRRPANAKILRLPARRGMAAPRCPPAFRGRNFGKASAHIASPARAKPTRKAKALENMERKTWNVKRLSECKDAVHRRLYISSIKSSYGRDAIHRVSTKSPKKIRNIRDIYIIRAICTPQKHAPRFTFPIAPKIHPSPVTRQNYRFNDSTVARFNRIPSLFNSSTIQLFNKKTTFPVSRVPQKEIATAPLSFAYFLVAEPRNDRIGHPSFPTIH